MKSTAIFTTKTDRDNHRSKDSGILAGLWSLPAVQYSWCELWLGVFAMVMFPHRLWNNENNELFVFSILLPTTSKFAWYVCMCMYVYIWYMYMYIYGCADDCNKLSSIIISYYFYEKEVTENPSVRREDGHGECSVSLAAVMLAITNMARCRRLRVVTVIDIICHCCCCFLLFFSVSETVSVPVVK